MKTIGNGKHPLKIHEYKGFTIERDGTKEFPWNVYKNGNHVGYGSTIKDCKTIIDDGCCEEELR